MRWIWMLKNVMPCDSEITDQYESPIVTANVCVFFPMCHGKSIKTLTRPVEGVRPCTQIRPTDGSAYYCQILQGSKNADVWLIPPTSPKQTLEIIRASNFRGDLSMCWQFWRSISWRNLQHGQSFNINSISAFMIVKYSWCFETFICSIPTWHFLIFVFRCQARRRFSELAHEPKILGLQGWWVSSTKIWFLFGKKWAIEDANYLIHRTNLKNQT